MKILHLTIKGEYYDMIDSGYKPEEYREDKPYWITRLCNDDGTFKEFEAIHFYNGGSPSLKYRNFLIECKGIEHGEGETKWGAVKGKKYFVIKLGDKIKQ